MNGEPNPLKFLAQWWFEVVVYPIQFLIERFADFVNESREKLKENCQISPFGDHRHIRPGQRPRTQDLELLRKPSDFFRNDNFYHVDLKEWFHFRWGPTWGERIFFEHYPLVSSQTIKAWFDSSALSADQFHFWPRFRTNSNG